MSEPQKTPSEAPAPPQSHRGWGLAKALALISGGVGLGFLIVIGVLCFLLFVVAPALLEWVTNTLGS